MSARKILFIRHAQSVGNTMNQDERAACEIPNHAYSLTDSGKRQAVLTGQYLRRYTLDLFKSDKPQLYFQSTFLRAQMTMRIILGEMGFSPTVITDSRLDEKWDGIFHELSKTDIEKYYPEQVRLRKRSGYYHYRAPGGESCPDAEVRIKSFLYDQNVDRKNILVVGHGRWAILLHKILFNLTIEEFLKLKEEGLENGGSENCSVIEYVQMSGYWSYRCVVPWKDHLCEEKTELA